MSFRKRNVTLGGSSLQQTPSASPNLSPGVRPSPLDGRATTSTGTQSLDDLLGGHAGLPLGHSLLIGENGTTDFAGALLRFYAAEGVVQGHQVHVVGVAEQWGRALPGLVGSSTDKSVDTETEVHHEKMKIAWRYERLGEFGTGKEGLKASPLPNRAPSSHNSPHSPSAASPTSATSHPQPPPFIHSFDLTKRLVPPTTSPPINYISPSTSAPNPYTALLTSLSHSLATSAPTTLHRLIIPTLLSPILFPPPSTQPIHLLPFLHSLRSLLREHPTRLTAILTLPLYLHPRASGLTRWIEHLMDGVLELAPFPYSVDAEIAASSSSGTATAAATITTVGRKEEKAQGLLKVHKLPVGTEKGTGAGGGGGGGEDLAFVLSRRRFVIRPFWLPPVDGEMDGQVAAGRDGGGGGGGGGGGRMPTKGDIEF